MGEQDRSAPDEGPELRGRRRGARRAVRVGTEREAVRGISADEGGAGWGEVPDQAGQSGQSGAHGSNDERLLRDVPPHW